MYRYVLYYLHPTNTEFLLSLADGKPTYTVTQKPPTLKYSAQMKFINLADSYQLPKIGTRYVHFTFVLHDFMYFSIFQTPQYYRVFHI